MRSSQPSEAVVWLDRVLGTAAAILLFCLMALTTADVVGRYIFNRPIRGAFEITELLLLTLIFAGLPLASRADEHVTLDFIDIVLGNRGRLLSRRFVDLVCGLLFLGLGGIEWANLGSEGVRKLCISSRFWIFVRGTIWHTRWMTRAAKRPRRLWDAYCFPGFQPEQTVCGVFGDPKARVIRLNRRSKKRHAVVAVASRWAGTIASCGVCAICHAATRGFSWNWR